MKKIIKWFKSLFIIKKVENKINSDVQVKTNAIPNPKGTPTERPR